MKVQITEEHLKILERQLRTRIIIFSSLAIATLFAAYLLIDIYPTTIHFMRLVGALFFFAGWMANYAFESWKVTRNIERSKGI